MDPLLQHLPRRPQSILVRYAITALLVGVSFLLVIAVRAATEIYGFFVLFPAILLASILFDRGSGIVAVALSVVLLYWELTPSDGSIPAGAHLLALAMFTFIAGALSFLSDGLRRALERASSAERSASILLEELAHRTKNDLAAVISILTIQARSHASAEVKTALQDAASRIRAIAAAHDYLGSLRQNVRIDMQRYLSGLCARISENLRGVRDITIAIEAAEIELASEHAITVGLVVNELVTNALKHAFAEEGSGAVRISLRAGAPLTLVVEDNGAGCPPGAPPGAGVRLLRLLVEQLGGRIEWEPAHPGCRVRVTIASDTARRRKGGAEK